MAFSNVLLSIMNNMDLSAAEIARRTNLSEAIISKYLHGKSEPKYKTLKQISEKLDIPLSLVLEEPPFESIPFLDSFKAVILHGLNKQGAITGFDDLSVNEVSSHDYWKIIDKFFSKIEDKGGYLQYTYKTQTFDDENPIVLKPDAREESKKEIHDMVEGLAYDDRRKKLLTMLVNASPDDFDKIYQISTLILNDKRDWPADEE